MTPVIEVACTLATRMKGLLGREGLPPGHALLIRPCKAIHTCRMKFALDVRFYDKRGTRIREVLNVRPGRWWIWGGWRAYAVLESAAGDTTFQPLTTLPDACLHTPGKGDPS